MRFTADLVTDAKRMTRIDLYGELARRADSLDEASFLVLPGDDPGHEIGLIRRFWNAPEIIAVDRNQSACDAAMRHGATKAIRCELDDINDPDLGLRYRWFTAVVLDYCQLLAPTLPGAVAADIHRPAKRAGRWLVVSVPYGRDDVGRFKRELDWHRRCWRNATHRHPVQDVPDKILGRLLFIWRQILVGDSGGRDMTPVRVYTYKGNAMPMMVVVFGLSDSAPWEPFTVKVSGDGLRDLAVDRALMTGTRDAAELYGHRVSRVAAWRAVRARRAA